MTDLSPGLARGVRSLLGRSLSEGERSAFEAYLRTLLTWQRRHRLVGRSEPAWIVENLLLDSLLYLRFVPAPDARLLDFGSGPGIPGIPLKIVAPSLHLTLLERRRRRASFLKTVVRELALLDTRVIDRNAEEALREDSSLHRRFDIAVSRCSGPPERVLRAMRPFVRAGGSLVLSGPPVFSEPAREGRRVAVERPLGGSRSFLVLDV